VNHPPDLSATNGVPGLGNPSVLLQQIGRGTREIGTRPSYLDPPVGPTTLYCRSSAAFVAAFFLKNCGRLLTALWALVLCVEKRQCKCGGIEDAHSSIFALPKFARWGQEAPQCRDVLRDCRSDGVFAHRLQISEALPNIVARIEPNRKTMAFGSLSDCFVQSSNAMGSMCSTL